MSLRYLCTGLFFAVCLMLSPAYGEASIGQVNASVRHQILEGFGASNVWSCSTLPGLGNAHPEIYDVIFGELGLDILRLRNTYGYAGYSAYYIGWSGEVIADGRARTGRPLKIMISSWSPQASLKSNDKESGGNDATLKGGPSDYIYDEYADWWAGSLDAWAAEGVIADYINIQNEPDYDASWDSCRFEPSQTTSIAGYDQAFEAVYNKLYAEMGSSMPKMLVSDCTGFNRAGEYIDNIDNPSHVYGYSHHLYNCYDGGNSGCAKNPDNYIPAMTAFGSNYNDKPILQTEYSDDSHVTTYEACMDLAVLMHNSLAVEEVAGYLYWQLTYGSGQGLVSITSSSWTINPVYYAMKHYSAFTDPNWQRVDASTEEDPYLRITAYISPDNNEMSVVIINTTAYSTDLDLSFIGFAIDNGSIYQTTSSHYCQLVGTYDGTGTLNFPGNSITTLALSGTLVPTNCQQVYEYGYILPADLTGDCYVNFKDLLLMTDYWLTDISPIEIPPPGHSPDIEPDEPDGEVEFSDFSKLAAQWMQCNDPENANCLQNW